MMAETLHRFFFIPSPPGKSVNGHIDVRGELSKVIKSGIANPAVVSLEPSYDMNYRYHKGYEDHLLKGRDLTSRPWNVYDLIKARVTTETMATDVGCGTSYKSLRLAPFVRLLIGVEPNEEMIQRAVQNALLAGAQNVCFVTGNYSELPFEDGTLDLVMGFLAPHNTLEIKRVLKPGGWAVIERVGDRDKVNLKEFFGNDAQGPRGQLLQLEAGERARNMEHDFGKLFSRSEMKNGFWDTEYTPDELLVLLENTPTIRGFSRDRDWEALQKIQTELMANGQVRTTQNRVLIVAQK